MTLDDTLFDGTDSQTVTCETGYYYSADSGVTFSNSDSATFTCGSSGTWSDADAITCQKGCAEDTTTLTVSAPKSSGYP